MRFGLALPHYDTSLAGEPVSWKGIEDVARRAERAGFHSIWVSDHLFLDWGKYGGSDEVRGSMECWTTLTALAACTSSVRLGTLTLCNDFRHPGVLAKMAASLDVLSGGRLDLGLGGGWYEPEYAAAGIDFDSPAVRIKRLGEAATIVKRLLGGDPVSFEGTHYRLDEAICRPRPAQAEGPPVWIGGKGDLLISQAVRHADGWNFSWIGDAGVYKERVAFADAACERRGRDPKTLRRSVGAYVLAGSDDRDARARYHRLAARTPDGVLRTPGADTALSWKEFKRGRIAGGADEVADRLAQLGELGVEEVIMSLGALPFQVGDPDDVDLIGEHVIPAFAEKE